MRVENPPPDVCPGSSTTRHSRIFRKHQPIGAMADLEPPRSAASATSTARTTCPQRDADDRRRSIPRRPLARVAKAGGSRNGSRPGARHPCRTAAAAKNGASPSKKTGRCPWSSLPIRITLRRPRLVSTSWRRDSVRRAGSRIYRDWAAESGIALAAAGKRTTSSGIRICSAVAIVQPGKTPTAVGPSSARLDRLRTDPCRITSSSARRIIRPRLHRGARDEQTEGDQLARGGDPQRHPPADGEFDIFADVTAADISAAAVNISPANRLVVTILPRAHQ